MENQNQFVGTANNITPLPTMFTEKPKMKLWKKILLILLAIGLLVVAVLYNIPRILSILYPGDAQLVDNSSLLLQKVSVSDEDNGFLDLGKVTDEMIKIPPSSGEVSFLGMYTNYTKPVQWDQKLVDQVLKDNEQSLSLLSMASNKNSFQIPVFADPANISVKTEYPKMNNWRSVAQLQAIKAISLLKNGKPDDALLEAVKLNKLGHNIISGQNGFIGHLVGVAIKSIGSKTVLQVLASGNFKKSTLDTALVSLKESSVSTDGYIKAFKFEYANIINSIVEADSEDLESSIKRLANAGEIDPVYIKYVKHSYYYKINQIKNLYTSLYKTEVEAIGNKCELDSLANEMKINSEEIMHPKKSLLFEENAVGKLLFSYSIPLGSVIEKQCQTDFLAGATQIQLALKQYKADKKALPTSLNELVPTYLSSIPLDPYDQKPIRYSASKKILYSVGLKQKDLGGSTGDDYAVMDNPTIKIEF